MGSSSFPRLGGREIECGDLMDQHCLLEADSRWPETNRIGVSSDRR